MSTGKKIKTAYTFYNKPLLIKGGKEYFDTLKKLIDESKYFLQIQVYIFEEDQTGREIAEYLKKAAKRGVKIQVLLDGFASRGLSKEFIRSLQEAYIQIRFFEPIFRSRHYYFGRRLHHKIIVSDGYKVIVGGLNISDRYNDLPKQEAWLDYAVLVEGESAFELHKLCQQFFLKKKNIDTLIGKNDVLNAIDPTIHCPIRIRQNDWVMNKNQISGSYMEIFRNAQKDITIMSSYFIPNKFFRKQMAAAAARGIEIKLILAGKSDVGNAKNAERYFYRWALDRGIKIFEYTKTVLDSKLAICDERIVTIGSYNINDISAFASIELNLDIENEFFAKSVNESIKQILDHHTIEIKQMDIKNNYTLYHKLEQWLSYYIFRLIFKVFTFYFSKKSL